MSKKLVAEEAQVKPKRTIIYGSDPLSYYYKHFPCHTRSEIRLLKHGLYNALRKHGDLCHIPLQIPGEDRDASLEMIDRAQIRQTPRRKLRDEEGIAVLAPQLLHWLSPETMGRLKKYYASKGYIVNTSLLLSSYKWKSLNISMPKQHNSE